MAINASVGVLVITLLVGHIFYAAISRIAKVENDYDEMMKLKSRAEAADVAKSQVSLDLSDIIALMSVIRQCSYHEELYPFFSLFTVYIHFYEIYTIYVFFLL